MGIKRYIWVVLIVVCGVFVTAEATQFLHQQSKQEYVEEFSRKTSPYYLAIYASLNKNLDYLAALQAYFQSAATVSREQFSSFVVNLIEKSAGIQAMEWLPRVPHDRRKTLETAAHFHGFTDFQFTVRNPSGEMVKAETRDEYYPVYYVEPFYENHKAFGFDMASNPVRAKALNAARDSGVVVLSQRITLAQEVDDRNAVLAFQPVYRRDINHDTVAGRQKSIKGFVLGVFRIDDIVSTALQRLPSLEGIRVEMIDQMAPDGERLLFDNSTFVSEEQTPNTLFYTIDLPVQGSDWVLKFTQLPRHANLFLSLDGLTWLVLVTGLTLTLLTATILLAYMNRAEVTAILVEERTRDLKISEKRAVRMAAESEHSQREAEIANSAKSNFLATMSHEIRTPLNGVLGMAQLLKNTPLDADQAKKVGTILSSGRTLLAIINDVLDMSKIEAGGIELEITTFSLSDLFSSVSTPFQSLADDKGIELVVIDTITGEDALMGDPVRMRQIIWNLLSNAIKFTQAGQVTLRLTDAVAPEQESGAVKDIAICISVEDTGTGIAKERLPHIFDAFTQEDTSITRKFGGSGLGLAIVKRLVELMDGSISAHSKLGEGTRFDVILPFNRASDADAARLNRLDTANQPVDRTPLRILVAEDNAVNAMIAETFLKQAGHTVTLAENGLEATRTFEDGVFDLVLMDIHMPEMNGIDATKKIRATTSGNQIPIIGLTAEAFAERHAEFRKAGMDDILTKPFTEEQLRDVLTTYAPQGPTRHPTPKGDSETHANTSDISNAIPIGDIEKLNEFAALFPAEKVKAIFLEVPKNVEVRVQEIRDGIARGDTQMVKDATHSLVGISGSMFAVRLFEEVKKLESAADDPATLAVLFPQFEKTVAATIEWWRRATLS